MPDLAEVNPKQQYDSAMIRVWKSTHELARSLTGPCARLLGNRSRPAHLVDVYEQAVRLLGKKLAEEEQKP